MSQVNEHQHRHLARGGEFVGLTELSVGADVPWQVTDDRRASQRTAESLASLAIDSCGLVRGWGGDKDFQQQMSANEKSLRGWRTGTPTRSGGSWTTNFFSPSSTPEP